MSGKNMLGAAILTATFVSMFAWMAIESGVSKAVISLALGCGLAGIIALGINLIMDDGK